MGSKERETIESLTQKLGAPGVKWDYLEVDGELIAVKGPNSLAARAFQDDLKANDWLAGENLVKACLLTDKVRFETLLDEQPALMKELTEMCSLLASARIVRRKKG
jgi:hypothetical protein